ncbi:MAG: hypothetical protein HOC71_14950 [Candidatus Latescibacteria bacterium]|jgi:hypothetical protein|nr:hypothetical protein [Candidatus Latescibacterota bacterium]
MKPFIIVSLIVFFSCSSFVSAQSHPDYYPLKISSEWKLSGYGTTPTITDKILGIEKINNIQYARIERTNGEQEVIFYARCEENRVYKLEPPQKEELIFDFNTEINQSWITSINYDDGTKGKRTGRIIGKDMTVKVPAGVFDGCIVYDITDTRKTEDGIQAVSYTYWLAPEIGVVKISVNVYHNSLAPGDMWVNDLSSYYIPVE